MSGISGVGGHHHHAPEVGSSEATSAPRAPVGTGGGRSAAPMQSLQRLLSQVETSANTKAIPAHQNW